MAIAVTCPICGKKSQIDQKFKGKRLRCPYPDCRQPFRVDEDGVALPIVEEVVVEPEPAAPAVPSVQAGPQVYDWQAAPPPMRSGSEPEPAVEVAWDAPPVQDPAVEVVADEVVVEAVAEESPDDYSDYYHPPRKKKKLGYVILGVLVALAGFGVFLLIQKYSQSEAALERQAADEFAKERYGRAQQAYQQLQEKFPGRENAPRWQFLARWSEVKGELASAKPDVGKALAALSKLHGEFRQKSFYKEYRTGIYEAAAALTEAAATEAEKSANRPALEAAQQVFKLTEEIGAGLSDHEVVEKKRPALEAKLAAADSAVATAEARKLFLDALAEIEQKHEPSGLEEAQKLYDARVKLYPALAKDKEIAGKLETLKRSEPDWIRFTKANEKLPAGLPADISEGPTLLVCPLVKGSADGGQANDPIVLGLSRGILYGLSQTTGEVRWALRVGVDTTQLPVRLPANPPQPELALVMSADTNTLVGLDVRTGRGLWHYRLGAACPAGPVLVGRRAYVPTVDGKVHEIEAFDGRRVGLYEIGQPLTQPGAFDPVGRRLYLPAAHKRIYVLDIENNKCAAVMYTNHTVGALRGAPVVAQGTLILAEAVDLEGMKVKAYNVSANSPDATPVAEYDVPGWSWFPPYFDGDNLGLTTDRGYLALFGLNRRTRDKPLFPLAPPLPIGEPKSGTLQVAPQPMGRSQVASVNLDEWWLVAGGRLFRHRFDLYRQRLTYIRTEPMAIGTPLVESQLAARNQRVVLVTQPADQAQTLATTVENRGGKLLWQRQLGMPCNQDPLVLGGRLLAMDPLGGLLELDPAALKEEAGKEWQTGGNWLASAVPDATYAKLIPSADGQFAVAIAYAPANERLVLRKYEPGKGITQEQTFRLEIGPAPGMPAVSNQSLMLPCRDGNLREFPLTGSMEPPLPLSWRDRSLSATAPAYAAFLSDTQLLVSDGGRRVLRWERASAQEKLWRKVEGAPLEFPSRIVSPLLIIGGSGSDRQVALADESGAVHLFSSAQQTTLQRWSFEGQVTRGPFFRGGRLGVVVNNSQLAWLDPNSDRVLWEYRGDAKGIVGEPQLVGNTVVVAEAGGTYVWLDATNGSAVGQPRKLKTRVVPAVAAVPLGDKKALAPLSDGTFLIMSTDASR